MGHPALEALRTSLPLFALEPRRNGWPNPKWRERIQARFGSDPLACPRCGTTMSLAEIWEPKRGHVGMKRRLETHRALKVLREAFTDWRDRSIIWL